MTEGFGRLAIALCVFCYYLGVRFFILYLVRNDYSDMAYFDWWWSWVMAVPVVFVSGLIIVGLSGAVLWISNGFSRKPGRYP